MSGVELIAVLGVAASAAQLINCSLNVIGTISEIYSRVKDAPNRMIRYTTQINQIIAACRAIQGYKDLNTPLIGHQLQSTFAELEHLHQTLGIICHDYTTGSSRKRVWKTFVGRKEKVIVTCFERLEKEKAALILCINIVHTQTLQNIENGVGVLVERAMGNCFSDLVDMVSGESKETKVQYPTVATISPVPGKQTAKMPASNSSTWRAPVRLDAGTRPSNANTTQRREPQQGSQSQEKNPPHKDKPKTKRVRKGQIFKNMFSSNNAAQYNGDEHDTTNAAHSYDGMESTDSSFQHNGNRACSGGSGAHKHQNGRAAGNSIQRNGNIGDETTDNEIRQGAGNQNLDGEGEDSDRMDVDEEGSEEEESNDDESDEEHSD